MTKEQTENQGALIQEKAEKVASKLFTGDDMVNHFDNNYIELFILKHNEFKMSQIIDFFHSCQLTSADPRRKDAYLVGYKSNGEMIHSIIHSYHFLLKQANRTGKLVGVECVCETRESFDPTTGEDKKELVAIAKITKEGNVEPTVFEAYWSEFSQKKYDGSYIKTWKEKPRVMLQKCAIANALRWAFPESLGNIFIQEEMSKFDKEMEETISKEDKANALETQFSEVNTNDFEFEVKNVKTSNKKSQTEDKRPSFKI